VNFFDGIILPRGTPARSGVMHSISSMEPVIHLLISQMYVQVALTLFCQHLMKGHSVRRCPS
jgi:hypothetical protein